MITNVLSAFYGSQCRYSPFANKFVFVSR